MEQQSAAQLMQDQWGNTNIHPLAALILLPTLVAILIVQRRNLPWVILPALVFVAGGQRLVLGGVDFGVLRLIGLFAMLRFGIRAEMSKVRWTTIDVMALGFAFVPTICIVLRGDMFKLMAALGMGFDFVSMYVIGRICLTDFVAWRRLVLGMALLSIPIAISLAIEKATARNMFAVFGGIPEITPVRDGKLRAQGAFAHPILAGAWFSAFIPLLVGIWRGRPVPTVRYAVAVGVACSIIVIFSVDSATAVSGLLAAGIGLAFFRYQSILAYWKWLLPIAFFIHVFSQNGLHGLMFARVSLVSGATGHHRYRLYDAWLDRFTEWFLIGSNGTSHWGWHLFDVTSEYILAAVRGGMLGLVCLIAIQCLAIKHLSAARKRMSRAESTLAFHITLAVLVQMFMFLAVSYFGQIVFLMGILPAGAMSLAQTCMGRAPVGQVVAGGGAQTPRALRQSLRRGGLVPPGDREEPGAAIP